MTYAIFDLDGTVIDSTHRQNTLPDGSLNLEHWMEHNRPDMIFRDSLLPLAASMRRIYAAGHKVVVCTARNFQPADCEFLAMHGLRYHAYLSRGPNIINPEGSITIGDNRRDGRLKIELLTEYFQSEGYYSPAQANAIMFDDNLSVIKAVSSIGIHCFNAIEINRREQILLDKRKAA